MYFSHPRFVNIEQVLMNCFESLISCQTWSDEEGVNALNVFLNIFSFTSQPSPTWRLFLVYFYSAFTINSVTICHIVSLCFDCLNQPHHNLIILTLPKTHIMLLTLTMYLAKIFPLKNCSPSNRPVSFPIFPRGQPSPQPAVKRPYEPIWARDRLFYLRRLDKYFHLPCFCLICRSWI